MGFRSGASGNVVGLEKIFSKIVGVLGIVAIHNYIDIDAHYFCTVIVLQMMRRMIMF